MPNIPVEHLVDVARSARRSDRAALAEAIGDLCSATGLSLSEREKSLAYEIISALIRDVETHVRATLADKLADQKDVPHDLILSLANDIIDVARPVIVRSVVLRDEDLINMIRIQAEDHQLAVAGRSSLPPEVTDKLVQTENSAVIRAALENGNAEFSARAIEDVITMANKDVTLRDALAERKDLSADQANMIYQFVDQELQRTLQKGNFGAALTPETAGTSDIDTRPHPRQLIGALEQNDLFRFEELFQELTDLSEQGATRILYDSGPEAIAIACKASLFERSHFGALLAHLQGGGEPEKYRQSAAYIKLMDYFERIDKAGADRVLAAWRQAPDDGTSA